MIKLGLTGGIASGKSTAAQVLQGLGAHIIDCDVISREITAKDTEGAKLLERAFGKAYFPGGVMDRAKIRQAVFSDPDKLAKLNAVTHPLIIREVKRRMEAAPAAAVCCVVAPLLFESGMQTLFDVIWTVSCDQRVRIERMLQRDTMTVELAQSVLAGQWTDAQRESLSHLVLHNETSAQDLADKVTQAYRKLISE